MRSLFILIISVVSIFSVLPAKASNIDFYFTNPTIAKGETAKLNWKVNVGSPTNTICFISGVPGLTKGGLSGSFSFVAESDLTASISCQDHFGSIGFNNAELTVTATAKPTINIDFTDEVIIPNKAYPLNVTTQGATACQLQLSEEFSFFDIGTSYSNIVVYDRSGVFYQTVKCEGPGGSNTVRNEVRVGTIDPPTDPIINYFYNTELSNDTGYTHLKWASTYTTRCTLKSGNTISSVLVNSLAYSEAGYQVSVPVGGRTFELTCYNSSNKSTSKSLHIPRSSGGGISPPPGGVIIK